MAIIPTDLTALDPGTVADALANVTQLVAEANPNLDLKRGVVHDTVVYYGALLQAQLQEELNRYLSAQSLLLIEADPTLADPGVVANVLSNWNVVPGQGSTAQGQVTIVLTSPVSVTIGPGTIFTGNGLAFTADQGYTAKPEASQVNSPSDVLISPLSDGTWAFTIAVTAAAVGSAYVLPIGTLLVPSALPSNYLTSYAADTFTGGLDAETNQQLITRFQQGIAAQATSNRVNMAAMLRNNPSFASAVGSIIGCGDEEMLRDQHTIFPGSVGGGRVDWYVRTQPQLATVTLTKNCALTAVAQDGTGTWTAAIGRDDAPGFYEVVSVQRPASTAAGTLTVVSDVRGTDLSGTGFTPDIATVQEAAYSRYQTSVITFSDAAGGQAVGTLNSYQITVSYLPQIDAIQDFAGGHDNRGVGSDVLVKAPVPCFVQLSLGIAKQYNQADPDTAAVAVALAAAVNQVGFTGRIYGSYLQAAIAGLLPEGMSASSIDMRGRIRAPDGSAVWPARNSGVLVVPSLNGAMVSPRTVQFFCSPASVAVDVRSEAVVAV